VPVADPRAARATLRGIQERWEQAGAAPRDSHERLEGGLRRVEERFAGPSTAMAPVESEGAVAGQGNGGADPVGDSASWKASSSRAQASGDTSAQQRAEEALAARRSWLAEAERTLAELSG